MSDITDPEWSGQEPPPLTDAELESDPDMGDPLDAVPDDYKGDPTDHAGADDHPPED